MRTTSTSWRQSEEWTVHELAERAGISGRTLRHYHQIGLLEPDRVGSNGYRYYGDRKSTRLNSSHVKISYAVFCLKKKKNKIERTDETGKQQYHEAMT